MTRASARRSRCSSTFPSSTASTWPTRSARWCSTRGLGEERAFEAAIGHRDAIRRFGRFPHRNQVLGRENTPEEAEYLKAPPSWGLTAEEFAEWEREKEARERAAG